MTHKGETNAPWSWGSEGRLGTKGPLDFEYFSKESFFLGSSGKKQISPLLAPS